MSKVQVKRGRGRPDVMGQAITGFIRSKPWNGRNVKLGDIVEVYSRQRASLGKLSNSAEVETKNANIQIQNMLRVGKLVRIGRGVYTIPASEGSSKSKSKAKAIVKSIEAVSAAVASA